jgi:hypothetical protein
MQIKRPGSPPGLSFFCYPRRPAYRRYLVMLALSGRRRGVKASRIASLQVYPVIAPITKVMQATIVIASMDMGAPI